MPIACFLMQSPSYPTGQPNWSSMLASPSFQTAMLRPSNWNSRWAKRDGLPLMRVGPLQSSQQTLLPKPHNEPLMQVRHRPTKVHLTEALGTRLFSSASDVVSTEVVIRVTCLHGGVARLRCPPRLSTHRSGNHRVTVDKGAVAWIAQRIIAR